MRKLSFYSITLTTLLLTFIFLTIPHAEEENLIPKDNLDQLDWLVGRWVGPAFGGECEEVWSPPMGGSMTGSFKLVVGTEIVFYELMTITIDSGKPDLRLKHFNADMTGWEEKDDVVSFKFVESGEQSISFVGLSYERVSSDTLRVTILSRNSEDKEEQSILNWIRQ